MLKFIRKQKKRFLNGIQNVLEQIGKFYSTLTKPFMSINLYPKKKKEKIKYSYSII